VTIVKHLCSNAWNVKETGMNEATPDTYLRHNLSFFSSCLTFLPFSGLSSTFAVAPKIA
jgi:hypothetical protein